jgi:parallel beta-helix repeat protein
MPSFSTLNHALQFGTSNPTVSIYGTDVAGYIVYHTSGSFYEFAPNTKYFALRIIFDAELGAPPASITLTPGNSITEQLFGSDPSIGFYVDGGNYQGAENSDITATYFNISGISNSVTILGSVTLAWYYEVSTGITIGSGSVTEVATNDTLTGGPITGSGTLGINLDNANTWVAKQTFSDHITVDGYEINLSAGVTSGQILEYNGSTFIAANNAGGTLPFVIANEFSGGDIGAKINNAMASLDGYGTVIVLDGNYTLSTLIIMTDGITLKFGNGLISNSIAGTIGVPLIHMGNNCSIIGSGWGTKLMDPVVTTDNAHVIGDAITFSDPTSSYYLAGNTGLIVRDLQIVGNPSSTTNSPSTACIDFGNCTDTLVDHVLFDNIAGYGTSLGAFSGTGNHGENMTVNNCTFRACGSQCVAVVNGNRVSITGNTFYASQSSPVTPAIAFIDCEQNINTDSLRGLVITGNKFYPIGGGASGDSCIQVTGNGLDNADLGAGISGVIANNTIDGGDPSGPLYLSGGIRLFNCRDFIVDANTLRFIDNGPIQLITCVGCTVTNNKLSSCGYSYSYSVVVDASTNCTVAQNTCDVQWGALGPDYEGSYVPSIGETAAHGSPDYNLFVNNRVTFNPASHAAEAAGNVPRIDLLGASSRAFNNFPGLIPSAGDAPLITNIDELRAMPMPGTRNAESPPVVMLGGALSQGDGGGGIYIYDINSSAADDSFTIIKPQYQSGNGRWVRETETELIANYFPGSDIGEQINNAMAAVAISDGYSTIRVLDGNYTISTCVIMAPNTTLILGVGIFTPSFTNHIVVLMKNNTFLKGQGINTVLLEPSYLQPIIVADYDTWFAFQFNDSGSYAFPGNINCHIDNICFKGTNTNNAQFNETTGAVFFGACKNVSCTNSLFLGNAGFGLYAGVSTSDVTISADGVNFSNNIFENVKAQNCGIINGRNILIDGNVFRSYPVGGVNGSIGAFIDCEANESTDRMENLIITNNQFDVRYTNPNPIIQVLCIGGVQGIIANNVLDANPLSGDSFYANIGMSLAFVKNYNIIGNTVRGCIEGAIQTENCSYCTIRDNTFANANQQDGGSEVFLYYSTYCRVTGNDIWNEGVGGYYGQSNITEVGPDVDYNIIDNNSFHSNPNPNSAVEANSKYDPQIILVGANSRKYNNYFYNQPMDSNKIRNVGDLRLLPNHYGQTQRPFTEIAGLTNPGDGGAALYYWDNANTTTDNGYSVIKPTNHVALPSGRWVREPQPEVTANAFPGSDIGAQINAATAALIGQQAIITVLPGDYTVSTIIRLNDGHTLCLNDGIYTPDVTPNFAYIVLGNNCAVRGVGSHWGAQLKEPAEGENFSSIICDTSSTLAGGPNDTQGPTNLIVENLQFVGIGTNTEHQDGTVIFTNCSDVMVRDCFWNGTSTYGITVGGSPDDGYFANNIRIENNKFDMVQTQNIAVVNARNVFVNDNLLRRGGITDVSGCGYIDIELNTDSDTLQRLSVCRNIIDAVGGCVNNPSPGIQVVGGAYSGVRIAQWGIIAENIITCGTIADPELISYGVSGIHLNALSNIEILNNVIKFTLQDGIFVQGSDTITIAGNHLMDCGGYSYSILLEGSQSCSVYSNVMSTEYTTNTSPGITERSDNDSPLVNICDYNMVYNNRAFFYPRDSAIPASGVGRDIAYNLTGPHSRRFNNFINDMSVDTAGVCNMADLRSMPIPGTSDSSAPATVTMLGLSIPGDVQPFLMCYNPSSTATDNGITVITPHLATTFSSNGRWLRAPDKLQLTIAQRDGYTLTSADAGFEIYNTDDGYFQYWNGGAWNDVSTGNSSSSTFVTTIQTTTYTASINQTVRVDPSSGGFSIILPTASGISGQALEIKNTTSSTNTITITPYGSETIDTSSYYTISSSFGSLTLRSDGTNWMVI